MWNRYDIGRSNRREWCGRLAAGSLLTVGPSWLQNLAAAADVQAQRPRRACILLWMNGGPSQTDTFDQKPGHAHNGPFQTIATRTPGLTFGEHLPGIAQCSNRLAVIRSMSTKEGDHGRARQNLRTGYTPQGSIQFPVWGSIVSQEYAGRATDLPNYVSILPRGLFNPGVPAAGFLGPDHAPLLVDEDDNRGLSVQNLNLPRNRTPEQAGERLELFERLNQSFLNQHTGQAAEGHRSAYRRAAQLMSRSAADTFEMTGETEATRERYGETTFGRGCLLARRLVERGVPFVEVTLGGWDTHDDNFEAVRNLCGPLDRAWSALMGDLHERGLLDSTLVVWMGEFGRTPVINPRAGRDHYPRAWSAVLGGGGIQGGAVVGRTSADGLLVEDRPVSTADLLGTICLAMGLDPQQQNLSNVARPIRLVDPSFQPIREILI